MNSLPSLKRKKDRDSTKPGLLCTLKGRKNWIEFNKGVIISRILWKSKRISEEIRINIQKIKIRREKMDFIFKTRKIDNSRCLFNAILC